MDKAVFHVPSISCGICAGKIQDGVRTMEGIQNVSVDVQSKMVEVEFNPDVTQSREIVGKITSLGYEVYTEK